MVKITRPGEHPQSTSREGPRSRLSASRRGTRLVAGVCAAVAALVLTA